MSDYDFGRLIYLGILALAVGGYFVVSSRRQLGKLAREAAVWGLIFIGAIAGYGLWTDIGNDLVPRQSVIQGAGQIEVPRSPDGHYYLTLGINGTPVRFVVDTGASDLVLSLPDARRAGIDTNKLAYVNQARTANGIVRTAGVKLDEVTLEGITDRGVRASVNGGQMDGSLLGMSYLSRFNSLEFKGGKLVLTR